MTVLEVTNDPVRDYLNSIGRTRLLTAEEEVALAKRIEVGVLAGERLAKRPGLTPMEKRELQYLADDGKLTVPVAEVFALSDAAKAFELSQTGHVRGKIAIEVSTD